MSSPIAGAIKNPQSQKARWALLERAAAIDRQASYESTSFGVGQVMGAHWQWLGYASVDALVEDARAGLGGQMQLMERFIEKSGLSDALRHKDWASFARGYNGPGFKKNAYDRKLAAAFDRLKSGDLYPSDSSAAQGDEFQNLRLGMRGDAVLDLQRLLTAKGHLNPQDGIFGVQTENAVKRFQKDAGLKQDGIFGPDTRTALEATNARRNPLSVIWIWIKSLLSRLR